MSNVTNTWTSHWKTLLTSLTFSEPMVIGQLPAWKCQLARKLTTYWDMLCFNEVVKLKIEKPQFPQLFIFSLTKFAFFDFNYSYTNLKAIFMSQKHCTLAQAYVCVHACHHIMLKLINMLLLLFQLFYFLFSNFFNLWMFFHLMFGQNWFCWSE